MDYPLDLILDLDLMKEIKESVTWGVAFIKDIDKLCHKYVFGRPVSRLMVVIS
jgi:hypothetical protein